MTEESFVLIQNPSKQSDLIIYGRIGLPPVFVLQMFRMGRSFVLIQNQKCLSVIPLFGLSGRFLKYDLTAVSTPKRKMAI
ncbi:hypothetical protein [Fluviibacter phosphoraccumulans]|nr:hypothetical protein [Fluviibacter phosphoraccumulans]